MFKKITSSILTALLLLSSTGIEIVPFSDASSSCVFTDVCEPESQPYYDAVAYLKEKGFIKGNPDGSFAPHNTINRAEILTILFRGSGTSSSFSKDHTFPDMKGDEWFAPFVSTAKSQGFVKGYPDGTFKAGNTVKLEEAVKMMTSFYHIALPTQARQNNPVLRPLFGYPVDITTQLWSEVADNQWYTPLMKVLYDFNLYEPYIANPSTGYYEFALGKGLSRGDAAMILYNTLRAKETINGPLEIVSTWESYQGNVQNQQDLYFYFNKPVKLSTAKNFIRITKDGKDITDYILYHTPWTWSNEQIDLPDTYAYKSHELRIDSSIFASTGNVSVTFLKGMEDLYGTSLQEDQHFSFTLNKQSSSLRVSGPSYSIAGKNFPATLTKENISSLSMFSCHIPTATYLSTYGMSTKDYATNEFLPFAGTPESNPEIKKLCDTPKSVQLNAANGTEQIDIASLLGTLTPGIHYLAFNAPEFIKLRKPQSTQRFIYVSDTQFTMKTEPSGKSTLWALDMQTATPRSQMELKLYKIERGTEGKNNSTFLQSSTTDKDGKALFTLPEVHTYPEPEYVIVGEQNGHFGIINSQWNNGIEPYQYGLDTYSGYWGHDPKNDYTVYMHTDRKIYRPGHTVEIKGIVRKRSTQGYDLPGLTSAQVSITDSLGNELSTKEVTLNSYGSFTTSLPLTQTAPLGTYSVVTRTATPVDRDSYGETTMTFEVEEYRKPEFRVEANTKDSYNNGDILSTTIEGTYYFGTPVAGGKAHVELSRETLYVGSDTEEWFNFFNTYSCYFYCKDTSLLGTYSKDLTLDDTGKAALTIPLSLDDSSTSGLYTMDVSVMDANGREVHTSQSFKVHKTDLYAGIRSLSYVSKAGDKAGFEIYTMDKDSKPKASVSAKVSFYKENWTSYQSKDISDSTIENSEHEDVLIAEANVTTGMNAKAQAFFTPKEAGTYYALVSSTDSHGTKVLARDYLYVYDTNATYYTPWASGDEFKVQVLLDKPSYNVGDTAKIMVQSPFTKSMALVTVEREKIYESMLVPLENNASSISLPIATHHLPNAFIAVSLFDTSGTPDFRQGYAKLFVNTSSQELHIDLQSNKKVYAPRDTVEISVRTTDASGKKVPAEVSLAVVDEAVIALAGGVDRDIMNAFYYFRGIVIDTAASLTHLVQKSELSTVGGSGKGGSSGLPIKRGNMKDTAYWNGTVQTNNNGEATISFTLPDNLTHWEILSIGATKDTKVGSSALQIETHQDLVAQPVLPRFVRNGDTLEAQYSIFNLTEKPATVNAQLKVGGMDNFPIKTITIGAQKAQTVSWTLTVADVQTLTLSLDALSKDVQGDRIVQTIPVLPAQVEDTVSSNGKTIGQSTINLSTATISKESMDQSVLNISVSSSPAGTLKKQLSYLLMYPYGCAEQTSSVLLGNIYLKKYMESSRISLPDVSTQSIENNVLAALPRLYNYQSSQGGWSLWGGDDYVEPYLSTYVLSVLSKTEAAGFSVDTAVIKKARTYLTEQLAQGRITDPETKAFTILTLSAVGAQNLTSYADTLYNTRSTLSINAQSYLLLYYNTLIKKGATQYEHHRTTLQKALADQLDHDGLYYFVKKAAGSTYYSYGSIASNSLVLEALSNSSYDTTVLEGLAAYLTAQSQESRWATTHDTLFIIRGLDAYMSAYPTTHEAFEAEVFVGTTRIGTASFPAGGVSDGVSFTQKAPTSLNGTIPITIKAPAGKTVYYQSALTYLKSAKDQYVTHPNLSIKRSISYYQKDGSLTNAPTALALGSKVRVTLTFAPNYTDPQHRKIAIEDHLPAGLEALNPGILTNGKTTAGFENGWAEHVEMRDDRVLLYLEDARSISFSYDAQVIGKTVGSYPAVHAFEMYNPGVYAKSGATALATGR